jgi:cytosine/adenosine deaminase-related metal-dependent hydrolase
VLSPRFSIAHGVWLSEAEINILADTGAAISHNPSSNLRLRAGIAPLNALLAANVTTALGMDGTTLNDDEDMLTEMRLAMRLHRTPRLHTPAPAPTDIFQMATLGGAKLLRKDTELGRLAPGYLADIVVLDTQRLSWPWIAPESDPRELLLMRARADDVRTVVVGGEVVWNDGQPTRFDLAAAGKEFAEELQKIPYSQQQAKLVERLKPYIESYYAGWETAPLQPYITYNSKR